ncbi:MAG TPA: ABC transporter permease [Chloroflexota bacterium]|nr:ABC transporter permease [Chloroflexota bacterium]
MAAVAAELPLPLAGVQEPESTADQVSQWTLMRWRFMQNRLSVVALILLVVMYLVAALAPFLTPNDFNELDTEHSFAAPTSIVLRNGWPSVCPLAQTLDPNNFKWLYESDCERAVPIRLFVHGASYKLLWLIPTDIHLFGVVDVPPPPKAAPSANQTAASSSVSSLLAGLGGQNVTGAAATQAAQQTNKPPKLFLFGADQQGRDLFARVLEGSRVSLTIGIVGVVLSLFIGSLLGAFSGYMGGAVDDVIQRTIEIIRAVPTIPLWAAFAAALPRTTSVIQRYLMITLVLSLINWTGLARELRGKVLAYRSLDFISAARLAGSSHLRIVLSHMLPNAASHIIVVATLAVPASILGETTLSFLGLGMLPPAVSWGTLLRDTQQIQSVLVHPWMMLPAVPVIFAVACYFLLGDGLRDAIDPYS